MGPLEDKVSNNMLIGYVDTFQQQNWPPLALINFLETPSYWQPASQEGCKVCHLIDPSNHETAKMSPRQQQATTKNERASKDEALTVKE
jgi:hypothetical protein